MKSWIEIINVTKYRCIYYRNVSLPCIHIYIYGKCFMCEMSGKCLEQKASVQRNTIICPFNRRTSRIYNLCYLLFIILIYYINVYTLYMCKKRIYPHGIYKYIHQNLCDAIQIAPLFMSIELREKVSLTKIFYFII